MEEATKVCSHRDCHMAGQPQPLSAFYPDARNRLGVKSHCRKCQSRMSMDWRRRNRERVRERERAWRKQPNTDGAQNNTARVRQWRERHAEHYRTYERERARRNRARQRAERGAA